MVIFKYIDSYEHKNFEQTQLYSEILETIHILYAYI